jgi:LytS/YehU family sensor histidine kinase
VLAYYYSRRSVEREVELAGARLGALQAQLRPHFMFNALNSVAMLVRGGRGPEAVEMIARVSDLLRNSLDEDERAEVALEEEVALARRYLAIEEVRFADRLRVRVELTEEAKAARVPRLILQPVVENAVRHGIGQKAAAGRVEINASTTGKELIVVVRDDGPGPNGNSRGHGVGLKNTRERLRTAYGEAARFTLEHGAEGGAVATMVIPLR